MNNTHGPIILSAELLNVVLNLLMLAALVLGTIVAGKIYRAITGVQEEQRRWVKQIQEWRHQYHLDTQTTQGQVVVLLKELHSVRNEAQARIDPGLLHRALDSLGVPRNVGGIDLSAIARVKTLAEQAREEEEN